MKLYLTAILFLLPLFYIYSDETELAHDLELGMYRMLDYPVNIRSQPNTSSTIIGRLQLNDEIEIIENTGNPQIIEGVLQNWYKILFNNTEGYIWGGYISLNSWAFQTDIWTKYLLLL